MKIINTIAALTCVGYALHFTDILPASDYEILANRAIGSARGMIDKTLKQYGPAVAEAPKPCPPTECKPEVVRTVGSAPSPQAVVVTVPAPVAATPAPAVPQTTWPSLSLFQSQPQVTAATPAATTVATPAAPASTAAAAPTPAAQAATGSSSQPSTMTFSAATPVITTVAQPRLAAAPEPLTIQTETAVAKPASKAAGSEGADKPAVDKTVAEKPAKTRKSGRDHTAGKRPAGGEGTREWVSVAMSRS